MGALNDAYTPCAAEDNSVRQTAEQQGSTQSVNQSVAFYFKITGFIELSSLMYILSMKGPIGATN